MVKPPYGLRLKCALLTTAPALPCCREAFVAAVILRHRSGPQLAASLRTQMRRLTSWLAQFFRENHNHRLLQDDAALCVLRRRVHRRLQAAVPEHATAHCQRAFLRGLFVQAGYLQDPQHAYHLELPLLGPWMRKTLRRCERAIRLKFGRYRRRGQQIAYLKGRRRLIRFLQAIEQYELAHVLTDVAAARDLLSLVNRQVNAETANIDRQVAASDRIGDVIDDLLAYPDQTIWSDILYQTALFRKQYPQDSLEILGKRFRPPLTKSAINHRLRRIIQLHRRLFHLPEPTTDNDDTTGKSVTEK